MTDKSLTLSAYSLTAGFAWAAVVSLVAAFCIVGSLQYGILACATSALAATLSIRCFCCTLGRNMRCAFELGKDAGLAEARSQEGRPLHRV